MNDEQYINSVTLEYLLNPVLYEKINSQKNSSDNLISKDIKFYRPRICQITKDMCKGRYLDDNLKTVFLSYAHTIIYYLKQLDEKDILQSDYAGLQFAPSIGPHIISDPSANFDVNNLIINKPKEISNLDDFVKKINVDVSDKILPTRRVANINDPKLRNKGVKKKNITII